MERNYAGILGLLAFVVVVVRGWGHGAVVEVTLRQAWLSMWVFAAVGFAIAWLAGRAMDEAVRGRFSDELAAAEQNKTNAKKTTTKTTATAA